MTFYKDYFGIKPDYVPCMTLADINKTPKTWLGFYPHNSFVEILRELLKSLEGGNKTLWITGAYGTGKSFASLVLQKLFMDDDSRVLEWLDLRMKQIPAPVRNGVLARRRDKVLVVYDVNADGVDAKNQFLMRLQRGITKALETGGHIIPLKGQLDEVIERIRQDEPYFFAKRDEMQTRLSHLNPGIKTANALEKCLRDKNLEAGLVSDAMRVLEARKVYLDLSPEEFLEWVEASLEANGLSKLVYIWDEFSAFMERNRMELKTLEQLAEAAQQGRFYFVPVTHTDISSYVAPGSESAKKANNRFTFRQLDLPNETALKLAADAFVVNPEKQTEWMQERDVLWHSVKGVAENYMAVNKAGIDTADFMGILPLHPMAAFLLKHLSVTVGANQRSMFEFLNGEEFRAFIEKGGMDVFGHQFLTVDHLWCYFVERDDLGTIHAVQDARAEYARREKDLQPEEQRVFKAVLLFGLIEQMQGKAHPLLSVAVENILRSFEGDGALPGVDAILRNLAQKHCFDIVHGRCERFRDRSNTKEIEEKKAALEGKFGDLVLKDTEPELAKQLKGVNYGGRFDVRSAGVSSLSASNITKKESFGDYGNRILVQFILARDEQEQLRIPEKAKELAKQFKDHRMLFVTLPEVNFCRDNAKAWDEFTENSARLALATDSASKRVFETQVNSAKVAWLSKVTSAAKLIVYKPNLNGEPYAEEVTWAQLKIDWLTTYAKQMFGAYTDHLSGFNISAFAAPTALQSWALAGMEFDKFAKPGAWKTVVASWQKCGVTGDEKWFDANPSHPLMQLMEFCKKRQDNTVGDGNPCSIRKLYIDLQRPPFGLMCVPHSAFVLGFVLKTWLTGQRKLQWTDGVTSKTLDEAALAEIIEAVVKDDGANEIKSEKLICRLSKEEKAFIEQSSVIFGNSPLADGTVEAALNAVGTRLGQISQRVPLWVLPEYIRAQADPSAEAMSKVLDALCAANVISSKGDTETRGNKVKEIGKILLATPGLAEAMAEYMTPVVFEKAFQQYVDSAKPELKTAAERGGDLSHIYCKAVKNRFAETSGWLWKPGDAESVLEEVFRQTLCAEHVRGLTGSSGYMGFEDAFNLLQTAVLSENKVPTDFWVKKFPALQRFFDLLNRQSLSGEDVKNLEEILEQQNEVICQVFFDVAQGRQLGAMREIFGELWPIENAESRELYNVFPQGSARIDEQSFKVQGRNKIEEYSRTLVSKQVGALWHERTGTDSPVEWSTKHALPAECLLAVNDAKYIVDAVANPGGVSAERLQSVYDVLRKEGVFLDVGTAGEKFLKGVLPVRYQKIGFSVGELSDWLSKKLGDSPGRWLTDGGLRDAVEAFVKQGYDTHARKQAAEKVSMLPDAEAKILLLNLIDEIPDVGLSVLE
ncbi:transposase [Geomonas ferrireducens]|uniref:transposase n=1 Tax=Geomonas ferrireducens TaxID=2570227 RepID=UPI0010A80D0A|nr:transposase [Geomonas ferrireducens]